MKLRNVGLSSLFYFLYMFGACFVIMLAESLLVYIIDRFVAMPYPTVTILRVAVYTLGVVAVMAVLGWGEGYRAAACSLPDTILGGVLALIPSLLFSMLFNFQAFVSGGVRFAAGLSHNGMSITEESLVNATPYSRFLLFFALYGIVYIAALTIAKHLGAARRVMDRAALRHGEDAAPADDPSEASAKEFDSTES